MSDIEKIKQLRHSTGAGFKDCNAAIQESKGDLVRKAKNFGLKIFFNHAIINTEGRKKINSVIISEFDEKFKKTIGKSKKLSCDLLCVSGGWTPTVHLFSQSRGKLIYRESDASFIPYKSFQKEISSDIEVKIPEAMSVYVKGVKGIYELQLLLTMEQYREQHNTPLVNGMRTKILDSALAYPASRLDELDHDLVVKVKEITRFIQSLEDTPQEDKPIHGKERNTFMFLLSSAFKKANFDLKERAVAGKIRRATESNNTPVSEQTISDLLPKILDAVDLKQNK